MDLFPGHPRFDSEHYVIRAHRVSEFAFKVKGLAKVIAVTQAENAASISLLQRFGFRLETELSEGRLQFGRAVR